MPFLGHVKISRPLPLNPAVEQKRSAMAATAIVCSPYRPGPGRPADSDCAVYLCKGARRSCFTCTGSSVCVPTAAPGDDAAAWAPSGQ